MVRDIKRFVTFRSCYGIVYALFYRFRCYTGNDRDIWRMSVVRNYIRT